MVIVLRVISDSPAWEFGLRPGDIARVVGSARCACGDPSCPVDTRITKGGASDFAQWSAWLRKIDPPEPGRWEDCAWQPSKTSASA